MILDYLISLVGAVLVLSGVYGSDLNDAERHLLLFNGENSAISLEFFSADSINNKQVIIDKAKILFNGDEYFLKENWKGSFLNHDELFYTAGKAYSENGKSINIFIFGKFLTKIYHGSLYDISSHIRTNSDTLIISTGEIHELVPKFIQEKTTKKSTIDKNSIDMLFLIVDSSHRFQYEEYLFTTRIYDKAQNPTHDWSVKGGEISGAKVSLRLLDKQFNTLNKINGTTNKWGWFDGRLLLGSIFPQGEYLAEFMASFQNKTITEIRPLYVFEGNRHAITAYFKPISDISRGFWLDNKGNQNNLMYDDLDEWQRDDSDYVHSRGLGGNQNIDTFQVKMGKDTRLTKDHPHYIIYTIRKDSPGGNEIKFTITLYEDDTEIASWTHENVDENFIQITNILTREQANAIHDYNSLSLKITAECTICDGAKRNAEVSWIQFIV